MKRSAVTLVASVFAVALSVSPTAVKATSSDEADIRALEDRFAVAVNAKDVNAIMKVYVPDESLLVFDVTPPRQYVGAKAYRKDWEDLFASFTGAFKFELTDLSVTADGTMGFSHSIQRILATDTKGRPIELTVRVTDVYRKIQENWLVVHEHVSIPVDLDTGTPDLLSKP
jgi:uncharacterized protein (TIGR02246 family)